MKKNYRFNEVIKSIIIAGDLCILTIVFISLYYKFDYQTLGYEFKHSLPQLLVVLNLTYLLCNYSKGTILHKRIVRPERIVYYALRNTTLHALAFISIITLTDIGTASARFFITFYSIFFFCVATYRLGFRYILKKYRKSGGNSRTVILVGVNMTELYKEMTSDPTIGFRIVGYFNDFPSTNYPHSIPYLGTPNKVVPYLQSNSVEQIYCCLPSIRSEYILPIINYCENHLIRFYSIPDIRNYLHHRVHFEMFGNVPIFTIREEPLTQVGNRIFKRIFDILFSGLFLITLFPIIYLIVGIAIKVSSPGPIFFRQKRSGENGDEFWCYKFRSMHVNKDCDKQQATKNDPRKTKLGNFIRKSSIDELPQFINVFLGQMSIVGPRPHMLKHTKEYSQLIDKYMVRHFIKPGVTGWAQVNGFRGETKELWQMEGRIERDIWYLEHWNFLLDFYIVYKTIKNTLHKEEAAY